MKKDGLENAATASQGEAIAALLLNILVLPGLGTVIWGDRKTGIWQIVLFLVGVVLLIILIGALVMFAAWIWALVSGIQLVKSASP